MEFPELGPDKFPQRVLIVGPTHDIATSLCDAKLNHQPLGFPNHQQQSYWTQAVRELGVEVETFLYTDNLFFDLVKAIFPASILENFANFPFARRVLITFAEKPWDRPLRTHRLLDQIQKFQPHVILISGGGGLAVLGHSVWRSIKKLFPELKLVLLNGMRPSYRAAEQEKKMIPLLSAIVTNDESFADVWKSWGAKRVITLPISAIHPPAWVKTDETLKGVTVEQADIVFIGSLLPESLYRERVDILEQLADFNLAIYSPHPQALERIPQLKKKYRGTAMGRMQRVIYSKAKVALNIHGRDTMPCGANIRTFEIAASRCPQIVDRILPGLFEPEKEILLFENISDLRKKLQALLTDEGARMKIASAAYEKVMTQHNYKNRFQSLFRILKEERTN